MRKSQQWIGKLMLLNLCAICLWVFYIWSQGASVRAVRRLGGNSLSTLMRATKVEAFRIGYKTNATQKIRGYAVLARGKPLNKGSIRQLKHTLLTTFNEDSIFFGPLKGCDPQPGVAFRLWKSEESLDIAVCYECSILLVERPNKVAFAGFDGQRPQLVKLAKEAFPRDKEIQALKED